MHKIYRHAYRVVSWLGSGDSSLLYFLAYARNNAPYPARTFNKIVGSNGISENMLSKVCNLEYWSRLWVVPEVNLASDLVFWYGTSVIQGHQLLRFVRSYRRGVKPISSTTSHQIVSQSPINGFLSYSEESGELFADRPPDFKQTLFRYGLKSCSDHREIASLRLQS